VIATKADDCALCGAKAETGFNGDDFARNIKRARCSNEGCERHYELLFHSDAMVTDWPIPDVDSWNEQQRTTRE
jgi:hypothetical protein